MGFEHLTHLGYGILTATPRVTNRMLSQSQAYGGGDLTINYLLADAFTAKHHWHLSITLLCEEVAIVYMFALLNLGFF